MKKKRYLHAGLLLVLIVINLYILYNRNNGYKYFAFKTYTQLYVTDSTFYLADVHFSADSLQLIFSLPPSAKGYVLNTLKPVRVFARGNTITIPIKEGKQECLLTPIDTLAGLIKIAADHSLVSVGPQKQFVNEFTYCNLYGPQIQTGPLAVWKKRASYLTTEELATGTRLLRAKTHALNAGTDSEKVMEIAKFVGSLPLNPSGIPATETAKKTPYEQILLAQANKTNLICGNYAAIVYYLCNVLNLPNRMLTYQGPAGNWQYGEHYLNEIYLRDKQQWVVADGMSNIYMPHDSVRYYNVADIKKLVAVNGFGSKYAYRCINDSMHLLPYSSINQWHTYYNASNANLCFIHPDADLTGGLWKTLKDFYSFNSDIDFYSDVNANNWLKIFIKMAAFVALVFVFAMYIFAEIKSLLMSVRS